jgi:hypothetical protein
MLFDPIQVGIGPVERISDLPAGQGQSSRRLGQRHSGI